MKKLLCVIVVLAFLLSGPLWAQEQQDLPWIVVYPELFGDGEVRVCFTWAQLYRLLIGYQEHVSIETMSKTNITSENRTMLRMIMEQAIRELMENLGAAMRAMDEPEEE
jgi:hypothetical protein